MRKRAAAGPGRLTTRTGAPARGSGSGRRRVAVCSLVAAGSLSLAGPAAAESYRVQPGDTLSEIAEQHGISTADLLAANGLTDPNRVVAGDVLTLPGGGAAPSPATTHRVEPGETLSAIAKHYGLSVASLAAANGIDDPNHVRDGSVLQVTGGGSAPAPAVTTTSYTVRRGDTLSTVARRFGTTTSELLGLNRLADSNHIRVGQTLQLPAGSISVASTGSGDVAAAASRYPGLPRKLRANPDRLALIPRFEKWAAHYGVPVEFLMGVTWLESGWQNHVVSHAGAVGIGQLMPDTSRWLAHEVIGVPSLDPTVPDDNIRMTAAFLSWLQRAMPTRDLALAAYYQGPTSVRVLGVYPVTDVYVAAANSLIQAFEPA